MSMTTCLECGHEISNMAIICPNCGFPVALHSMNNKTRVRFSGDQIPGGIYGGKADLLIDGTAVGCVGGRDFDIMLTPGKHTLIFKPIEKVRESMEIMYIPEDARFLYVAFGLSPNGKQFCIKYVRQEG